MKKQRKRAIKVTEQPACCPKCGSTDRTGKTDVYLAQVSGTRPDGKPYNRIRHWRAKCKQCGQSLAYLAYEHDSADRGDRVKDTTPRESTAAVD